MPRQSIFTERYKTTINIEKKTWEAFQKLARSWRMTSSALLNNVVEEFLKENGVSIQGE
jgi:predicted DNA-binding ribbon-helix-helix protein